MPYMSSPLDTMSSQAVNSSHTHTQRRWSRSSTSHSYRVEKPRSTHNSPMVNERRKTTTGAKLYATLDDHFRMMMGIPDDQEFPDPAQLQQQQRPVSWHPSSTHFNVQPQVQDWSRHHSSSSGESSAPSDFYSLSARNSSYMEPTYSAYPTYQTNQSPQDSYQTQSYDMSSYSTPATEPMPWYLQEWARKNQEQTMPSQSSSNDFLPIQHPAPEQQQEEEEEEVDEEMEDSGKELIGMGLYDVPDPTEGWGSLVEATGKGLKLEETWTPPEEEEEEEDADEEEQEDDDASSEDGEDELPPPPPPAPQPQHFQVPAMKTQVPTNMAGQSFFFEEDDSVTKEWWFHQLRQPSMPVRDAGIGYGWL